MTMTFPNGPVQTKAPWGAFGIDWDRIARHGKQIEQAADEFGVEESRLAGTEVIESQGEEHAVQYNSSNGNSYGLVQVVPYGVGWKGWSQRVIDLAGLHRNASVMEVTEALFDPLTNLRVGASILRDFFNQHGSWDRASSAFFLGNPDWQGADTVNGNTGQAYRTSLIGLMSELAATGGPVVADDPTKIFLTKNPFPKPTIYNLATDYARFGLDWSQANKIITNRFENRSGGSARFIVNHIQDGTTNGSLNWWATGPGVQASSTVMANKDGSILRIVPEQHGPWTNGDVCNPTEKSARLRALGGNPNCYSLTLEAEGKPGINTVSYTDAQLQAILWQFAEWMVRYELPLANVLSHASINYCDRVNCPGNANMVRVLDELKKAATAPVEEKPDLKLLLEAWRAVDNAYTVLDGAMAALDSAIETLEKAS